MIINSKSQELTILGLAKYNDGLGRISITFMDLLNNDFKINFIKTREYLPYDKEIPSSVLKIINSDSSKVARVVILTDSLNHAPKFPNILRNNNMIKIAYSMFETSRIPEAWVGYLNNYFDAVVVPDQFLVSVYKQSGVRIPIFVLPLAIYLDEFLNRPVKNHPNKTFVFGCLSSFDTRKNHELLIESFTQEFRNEDNVILKLNGREYFNNKLKKLNKRNVKITHEDLHWSKYIHFMSTFDCYVSIAKGEGFSIPPREALALGIPCIVADNTAQKTLCQSGLVVPVVSNIFEKPVLYEQMFQSNNLGYFFNCTVRDLRAALRHVYNNYKDCLAKAHLGREWVKRYRLQSLKKKYCNIIKPKKVILGEKNIVNDEYLMTNSKKLFDKYKKL